MGESHTAREQNEETVEEQAKALRDLIDASLTLLLPLLLLTPFETLLRLYRVDNVRNDRAAHG